MPLYGNELGPDLTPFEAGLGRVVKFDKPGDFVGRSALAARASAGPRQELAGLTLPSPPGWPGTAIPYSRTASRRARSRAGPRLLPWASRSLWRT